MEKKQYKKSLIILCPYPVNKAPSQRFRFEQQLTFLQEYYSIRQLSFWSVKTNDQLYKKGAFFTKVIGLVIGLFRRVSHLVYLKKADVILIHREVIPLGSSFFEWFIYTFLNKNIIFDFDDAIWNLDTSEGNKKLEFLKSPKKTSRIINRSKMAIAGNDYLANYAKKFITNVKVIPTTIDTNYHIPSTNSTNNGKIIIGWTGSNTTIRHFDLATPFLKILKEKYGDKIDFLVIGSSGYHNSTLDIESTPWKYETEIQDLQRIDIGIMPLPDTEWARGKCGFKGLQYMALEIPPIMSPVGVNKEIIQHGYNGYLANSNEDWVHYISLLIENPELRTSIGMQARKTVEEKYSVDANKNKYLSALNEISK